MEYENMENAFEDYQQLVISRIKYYLKTNKIRQEDFRKECHISQATLSKLLNRNASFSLEQIYYIAAAMKVEPSELTSSRINRLDPADSPYRVDDTEIIDYTVSPRLITNPKAFQFDGYLGKYYFYARPTVSNENKQRFLKGELNLDMKYDKVNKSYYCESVLNLYTGKIGYQTGEPVVKQYIGRVIISLTTSSCFTMMISNRHSDFCCLNWHHIYLNDDKLACRFAACLTSSAGTNRKPVMCKCIISRKELTDSELQFFSGQLNMNSGDISVSENHLYEFLEKYSLNNEQKSMLFRIAKKENCYTFSDDSILKSDPILSDYTNEELVNLLRNYSNSIPYAKISSKSDEILANYFRKDQNTDKLF